MKINIPFFSNILTKVKFLYKQLKLKTHKSTGRPLKIRSENIIALSVFKHQHGIPTKKSIWKIFREELKCSYKTLCVNMNRLSLYALLILKSILNWNQNNAHMVKHTDSTDIPVCLNKNSQKHKTMNGLASWGHSGKGWYYGLKLHLTQDLERKTLSFSITPANSSDREQFKKINRDLDGIFVADAGYTSEKLEREFFQENKRMLFAKPKKNMKKLQTEIQARLYDTRMLIELNFRNLKMLYNLVTSFPRSVDGYFANYIYSILASVLG
jgi:hypothetical protein